MTSTNAIKAELDLLKSKIKNTSNQVDKDNLCHLGLELTSLYLQKCGFIHIPSGAKESLRGEDCHPYIPIDQTEEGFIHPLKAAKARILKRSKITLRRRATGKPYVK